MSIPPKIAKSQIACSASTISGSSVRLGSHSVTTTEHSARRKQKTPPSPSGSDQFCTFHPSIEERLKLAAQWGNFSLAWSIVVQDGLSYFGNHLAMIAFAKKWGNVYVLGDPLGSKTATEALLDQFLLEHPKACFAQCSKATAGSLEKRGFYINEMGVDTHLDLTSYDFSGKHKEHLRYASNWLNRRDFRIVEDINGDTNRQAAAKISAAWRKTRTVKHREVAFLNRPLDLDNEWRSESQWQPESDGQSSKQADKQIGLLDAEASHSNQPRDPVRRFYLVDPEDQRLAFVFFDPIFDLGQVVGYVTSFKRRLPNAPPQAELGITKFAIEQFQTENIRSLNLGLSPLAEIENLTFKKNPFLHHSFRYLYRSNLFNRFMYPLQGHAEFKRRFRGETEKVHFASRTLFNDVRLMGLLRLCKVI